MAKHSQVSDDSRASVKNDADAWIETTEINEDFTDLQEVTLRNRLPATIIVAGVVTGKRYEFVPSGGEVKVDVKDVGELLTKRMGGCCGNQPAPYFEVVS